MLGVNVSIQPAARRMEFLWAILQFCITGNEWWSSWHTTAVKFICLWYIADLAVLLFGVRWQYELSCEELWDEICSLSRSLRPTRSWLGCRCQQRVWSSSRTTGLWVRVWAVTNATVQSERRVYCAGYERDGKVLNLLPCSDDLSASARWSHPTWKIV